ncbi:hypothetical protein FRB90_009572 [Tulasnella sp. 427]|nr:hypothetical protein FRB90_009572 [Tulasnella sp. 427]
MVRDETQEARRSAGSFSALLHRLSKSLLFQLSTPSHLLQQFVIMDQVKDLLSQPAFVFKCINIVVGAAMITGAVFQFIWHSFSSIIIGVYAVLFGATVLGLELYNLPSNYQAILYRYAGFLYSFVGRGVFYILVGVLITGSSPFLYAFGTAVGVVGLAYIVLEFVNKFDLPPSMVPPDYEGDVESHPVFSAGQ